MCCVFWRREVGEVIRNSSPLIESWLIQLSQRKFPDASRKQMQQRLSYLAPFPVAILVTYLLSWQHVKNKNKQKEKVLTMKNKHPFREDGWLGREPGRQQLRLCHNWFQLYTICTMSDIPTPHGLYSPRTAWQTEGSPMRRLPAKCLISVDAGTYFSQQTLLMTPLINKSCHLYDFDTLQVTTNSTTMEIVTTSGPLCSQD